MLSKLRLVFTIPIVFFCFYGFSQEIYWQQKSTYGKLEKDFSKKFDVQEGTLYQFDEIHFRKNLMTPTLSRREGKIVYFPNEKGDIIGFRVVEAAVLSPELSVKYPQIKSYVGYAMNQSNDKIRFSISHKGVQSMIVSSSGNGNTYMQRNKDGRYVLYTRKGNSIASEFRCLTMSPLGKLSKKSLAQKPITDQTLRRFRLAVSATGEYTEFHGGAVVDALAAINATVTRINAIFETDLGVTLELIPNTDAVIFTNPDTDPFTSDLSRQVQSTLTSRIGEANYDVGILLGVSDLGNGNAGGIGTVCVDNRKGRAFATAPNPEGDVFDIDFVAHEIGHQFGANHTWSSETEGTGVQVEPGSGTTIMGYAGIQGNNNVALNSDDYFHYVSISQIADYLETVSCAQNIGLTNIPPVITPTGGFTIPKSTPFVLTATATDDDVADVLTYAWEQIDDGVVTQATFGPNNPSGSNFRSKNPSTNPERYFPSLNRVLNGELTETTPTISSEWETLSNVERDLNFALTVRDNATGGGQVASDLVNVFVSGNAGPFRVTSQDTEITMVAGNTQSVTWDVANTFAAPVSATLVDIFLSVDGGLTYPITLAEDVINDGEHTVIVPGNPTTEGRIMVKASDNIFFAINSSDFTIEASEIVLNFAELDYEVCQSDVLTIPFTYEAYLGFNEEVAFSVESPPAGLNIAFAPVTAMANDTAVEITLADTENLTVGDYPIQVVATSASTTKSVTLNLGVFNSGFTEISTTSPVDAAEDLSTMVPLEWLSDELSTSYDVEIATDIAFTSIVESANVISNSYIPTSLENDTMYFWRVRGRNSCGEGSFNTPLRFTTIEYNCISKPAANLPIAISSSGTPTITSTIPFFEDLPVADINVSLDLDHTFLADLTVTLTSPAGTEVVLFSNSCGDLRNVNATFDNDAAAFVCSGNPAITGVVKPLGSLSTFNGESLLGNWVLTVRDNAPNDGGVLRGFSIEACIEGRFRPDDDNDGVFDDGPDLCLGTPLGTPVDTSGCPIFLFPSNNFMILAQSESCRNNDDGSIRIESELELDYTVTISGNSGNFSDSFTNTYVSTDLSAGTYTVCIDASDGSIDYETQCMEVVITEPEALSVSSKVALEAKIVELELEGASLYNVELNGVTTQFETSKVSLNLVEGKNVVKVTTNLPCQGVYEEQFYVSDNPVIFPNPFSDTIRISFGKSVENVSIAIFSVDGRLVKSTSHFVNGAEMELDLSGLPAEIYHLRIDVEGVKSISKIIKQ